MSARVQLVSLVLFVLSACTELSPSAPIATLTLIPPTMTQAATTVTPSSTPDDELLSAPVTTVSPAPQETRSAGDPIEDDPIAVELVALATRRLATTLRVDENVIELIDITSMRWRDSSLGCPRADQTYTPAEIDGYRIVLSANGSRFVFHTDFDQVIPCDNAASTATAAP